MEKKINIAIDGYSACGKSSTAKIVAQKLGYLFVDSGAMYRAVTYYFIKNKIDIKDSASVIDITEFDVPKSIPQYIFSLQYLFPVILLFVIF